MVSHVAEDASQVWTTDAPTQRIVSALGVHGSGGWVGGEPLKHATDKKDAIAKIDHFIPASWIRHQSRSPNIHLSPRINAPSRRYSMTGDVMLGWPLDREVGAYIGKRFAGCLDITVLKRRTTTGTSRSDLMQAKILTLSAIVLPLVLIPGCGDGGWHEGTHQRALSDHGGGAADRRSTTDRPMTPDSQGVTTATDSAEDEPDVAPRAHRVRIDDGLPKIIRIHRRKTRDIITRIDTHHICERPVPVGY